MIVRTKSGILSFEFVAENIVCVSAGPGSVLPAADGLAVLPDHHRPVACEQKEMKAGAFLSTPRLAVLCDKKTGLLKFRSGGRSFLSEAGRSYKPVKGFGSRYVSPEQKFRLAGPEALYGLGQYQKGVMNWRGEEAILRQTNTGAAVPFLVSTAGWAVLWDNPSVVAFREKDGLMSFRSEAGEGVRYYLITGKDIDELIRGYRFLTGQAPLFPQWACGYWQSKEPYESGAELVDVVSEFRRRKFPLDAIVQDWQYWGDNDHWNAMEFIKAGFKGFGETVQKLHRKNAKVMISIWPCFGAKTDAAKEMEKHGHLYPDVKNGWPRWARVYDAFHPEARQLYWRRASRKLFSTGLDAWWMDATEPELFGDDAKNAPTVLGPGFRWFNAYPLMTTRGVYEGQRAETDKKRVCILTRSGFTGQQRYATVVWSGDVSGTWEVYRRQIPAGLNFCMAGIPWWTTDIGGFFTMDGIHDGFIAEYHGGCTNEEYRELYTRWFQFGAFSPVFRSHGTNTPREPWRFGEPGTKYYDSLLRFTRLRYRLLPYLYSLSWKVSSEGATLMRGLAMDFPADRKVHSIADQYMFGKELLVSPVISPLYTRGDGGGEIVPVKFLADPAGNAGGLRAEYFADRKFGKKAAGRPSVPALLDCRRDPPPQCPRDRFSIRWSGFLLPPETGLYEFTVSSDDDIRLVLNGREMVCRKNKAGTPLTFRVRLKKGEQVGLTLELVRSAWSTMMKLRWRRPSELLWKGMKKTRKVYLPAGAGWVDFWTGLKTAGGRSVEASAKIDEMPLFVRAGSILPMGPEIRYAGEKKADPIELRIYPGADASFDLYEDEGDGYDYEKGSYSLIRFEWNDKKKTLTAGDRQGFYPGMLLKRTFRVVPVGKGSGVGVEPCNAGRVLAYDGKRKSLKLS